MNLFKNRSVSYSSLSDTGYLRNDGHIHLCTCRYNLYRKAAWSHSTCRLEYLPADLQYLFRSGTFIRCRRLVLMSICRGKSQKEEGNTYFTTALLLNFALLLISMTVCVLFMEDIAWLLGGHRRNPALHHGLSSLYYLGNGNLFLFFFSSDFHPAMTVHQNLP